MQVPGSKEPQKDWTVEEALRSTLGYLHDAYDEKSTPEARVAANEQLAEHERLLAGWLADREHPELAGVAQTAFDSIEYAKASMRRRVKARNMTPEQLAADEAANFPALARWQELGGPRGLRPNSDELGEMLRAGRPEVATWLPGLPLLAGEEGIAGEVHRKGRLDSLVNAAVGIGNQVQDVARMLEPTPASDTATQPIDPQQLNPRRLTLEPAVADLPSGWLDPKAIERRDRALAIFYGPKERRADGSLFTKVYHHDGTVEEVEQYDLAGHRDVTVKGPDGQPMAVHVTDDMLEEAARTMQGGLTGGLVIPELARKVGGMAGQRVRLIGGREMVVPKITPNPLVDARLLQEPAWQRAVLDVDQPQPFWWNATKGALGLADFAATMWGAGKLASLAAPTLRAGLLAASTRVSPVGQLAARGAAGALDAALAGGRGGQAGIRIAGTYFDPRLMGQLFGYNAVKGAIDGHIEPGKWAHEAWTQGVSMMLLGGVAKGTRAAGAALLRSKAFEFTGFKGFEAGLELGEAKLLEAGRARLAGAGADASKQILEHLAKRGILDQVGKRVGADFVKALYDSYFVGTGLGAYAVASARAQKENRSIGLGDLADAWLSAEAQAGGVGFMLAHGLGIGIPGWKNREAPDRARWGKGNASIGFELAPEARKAYSEIAGVIGMRARETIDDPVAASAFQKLVEQGRANSLDFGEFMRLRIDDIEGRGNIPLVAKNGLTSLVDAYKTDKEAFDDALRYEFPSGLDAIQETLLSFDERFARPGDLKAALDIQGLIEHHLERRAAGEPHGGDLHGQPESVRTKKIRDALATDRAAQDEFRRQYLELETSEAARTRRFRAMRAKEEQASIAKELKFQTEFGKLVKAEDEAKFQKEFRELLVAEREAERAKKLAAAKQAAADKRLTREQAAIEKKKVDELERANAAQRRKDKRDQARAEKRSLAMLAQAKGRQAELPLDVPPASSEALQATVSAATESAAVLPEHAHLAERPVELADKLFEGAGSFPEMVARTEEMVGKRAKSDAASKPVRLTSDVVPVERPAQSEPEALRRAWDKDRAGHFQAAAGILGARDAQTSLKTAAEFGAQAALTAQFATTSEARTIGAERQRSLAHGLLFAGSNSPKVERLAAAVSGLSVVDVAALREELARDMPSADARAREVIAKWNTIAGKEVITSGKGGQLAHSKTRQLLRLLSLGAPLEARTSHSSMFAGGKDALIAELRKTISEGLEGYAAGGQQGGHFPHSIGDAAKKLALAHSANLESALRALGGRGLRVDSPAELLHQKVAWALFKDQAKPRGTPLEGLEMTLGELEDGILRDLSEGATSRAAPTKQTIGATSIAEIFTEGAKAQAATLRGKETFESHTPETMGRLWIEVATRSRQILRNIGGDLGLSALDTKEIGQDGNPLPVLAPEIQGPEKARVEQAFLRALLEGQESVLRILRDNKHSEDDIAGYREDARVLLGKAQAMVKAHAALGGLPSGRIGAEAQREVDYLFAAIRAHNLSEPLLDGEARRVLVEGGWAEPGGELKQDAVPKLLKLTHSSVLRALQAMQEAARAGDEIDQLFDLEDLSAQAGAFKPDLTLLYAGMGPGDVRAMTIWALDGLSGFYDRRLSYPHRASHELLSPQGIAQRFTGGEISAKRFIESLTRREKLGPLEKVAAHLFVNGYQRLLGAPVRGLNSKSVEWRNLARVRASAAGDAAAQKFLFISRRLSARMHELNLDAHTRRLLDMAIEGGLVKDIKSQETWNAAFGEANARAYAPFLEINELFLQAGEELVQLGVLSPAARDALKNRYMPHEYIRLLYGAGDTPVPASGRGAPGAGGRLGDMVHQREGATNRADLKRIYDVAYTIPTAMVEVSQTVRLFRSLHSMVQGGVFATREEYDKMLPWERLQYVRAAVEGRTALGETAGLTMAERRELGVDRERELRERKAATIEQVHLNEWAKKTRASFGGNGQPELTSKMAALLDVVQSGYVTVNASQELSLLVDQTELGPSAQDTPVADAIQTMAAQWRLMRTVYNPRHFVLQVASNWATNGITGKVPMHDVLDPNGAYNTTARRQIAYMDELKAGKDPSLSADGGVREFARFVDLAGGSVWVNLIGGETAGRDALEGWLSDLHESWRAKTGGAQSELAQAIVAKVGRSGPAMAKARTLVDELSNSSAPEKRAEALRVLHGLYAMQELFWKHAAYLEGRKLGMSPEDAYHWGAEGTGDFQDRNPKVLAFSTQFRGNRGELYARAREGVGLGRAIGTAGKDAGPLKRLAASTEKLRLGGLGGPFWMYRMAMTPALLRASFNHPWKSAVTTGVALYMIRLISAMAGSDDEVREAQAGRDTFLNDKLRDRATLDAFSARYGNSPASVTGMFKLSIRDFNRYVGAFAENTAHAFLGIGQERPEAGMLLRAQGPKAGGVSTLLDFSSFVPLVSGVQTWADVLHQGLNTGVFNPGPQGIDAIGVGFLPSVMASTAAIAAEVIQGVEGRSWQRAWGEHAADLAATWSTPLAGLPWYLSREGQRAVGVLAWDGRSVGEMIERVPSSRGPSTLGQNILELGSRALLPTRSIPSSSVAPREGMSIFELLGSRPPRDAAAGDKLDQRGAELERMAGDAVLNVLSQAYKNQREYGGAPHLWYGQALDVGRDAVQAADGSWDVAEHPTTTLGQFVRDAARNPAERSRLMEIVGDKLKEHAADLKGILDNPDGLAFNALVAPQVFDRLMRATWSKRGTDADLRQFMYDELIDPKTRKRTKGENDGALLMLWAQLGMDQRFAGGEGDRARTQYRELKRFVDANAGLLPPDVGTLPNPDATLRKLAGPKIFDIAPRLGNQPPINTKLLLGQ